MSTDPRSLRVENYWTARARDFGTVRKNELNDAISGRWLEEFRAELPAGPLDILDVGTGTGYFAILLSIPLKRAECTRPAPRPRRRT